jgi:hypothetical protein
MIQFLTFYPGRHRRHRHQDRWETGEEPEQIREEETICCRWEATVEDDVAAW